MSSQRDKLVRVLHGEGCRALPRTGPTRCEILFFVQLISNLKPMNVNPPVGGVPHTHTGNLAQHYVHQILGYTNPNSLRFHQNGIQGQSLLRLCQSNNRSQRILNFPCDLHTTEILNAHTCPFCGSIEGGSIYVSKYNNL